MQGQISKHILKPNGGYCVYYPSNVFHNAHLGNITGYSPVLAGAYSVT